MGAEFQANITTTMSGGDQAISQLYALADGLTASSTVASSFDQAMAQAASALANASVSTVAAGQAVDAAEAKYVKLSTKATEAAAAVTAAAAAGMDTSGLQANADSAAAALQKQGQVLTDLQTKSAAAAATQAELAASMTALQSSTSEASTVLDKTAQSAEKMASSEKALGASTTKLAGAIKPANVNMEGMTALAKSAMGPMGGLFERANLLVKGLSQGGVAGAAILAGVALGALAVAAVAAVYSMAQYALTASDAAIKSQAMLQGLTGSAGAASEMASMIANVSRQTPQAASEVQKLAEGLYKSGKRGAELEKAVLEASYAASGLGKNPGPDLIAKRMGNLDVQAIKMRENIARIFAGPSTVAAVGKFQGALMSFVALFDTTSASGKALQSLVAVIVDPLFSALAAVAPVANQIFRGMVLAALLVAIAFVRIRNAVVGMLPEGVSTNIDMLKVALYGTAAVTLVLAAGVAVLSAALLGLLTIAGVIAFLLVAPFLIVPAAIALVIAAIVGLVAYGETLKAALASWATAGTEAAAGMISGLVSGIQSGAGAVYDAITAMAMGAIGALKGALGIKSPSKVFMLAGGASAEGFSAGVDDGADQVAGSLESLANPADLATTGASGGAASGKGASGGGNTITLTINAPSGDAAAIAEAVRGVLTSILEGDLVQVGGEMATT